MLLTWLCIVCTLIRHVLLIRSGHTELLIRSGYAPILFVTSIGRGVAKAALRHCLSHFIDRVAARTYCTVNVLTSRISFLVTLMDGSVVKHNMLKVQLYLYSNSGSSWPCARVNFSFTLLRYLPIFISFIAYSFCTPFPSPLCRHYSFLPFPVPLGYVSHR